jgi:hypothetical protein
MRQGEAAAARAHVDQAHRRCGSWPSDRQFLEQQVDLLAPACRCESL